MTAKKWTRRELMRVVGLGSAATAVAACKPEVVVETVETFVKETVEVEKVVKETVVVTEKEVVEIAVTPEPEKELEGTIVITLQGNDTQSWENLALAYELLHPNVNVRVELKPADGYPEWIRAQATAGIPEASYVNGNVVQELFPAGKFLDFAPYFDKMSPYTNQPWRDDMEPWAVSAILDPVTGECHMLSLETVQVLWFYNKSIFEEVGITDIAAQPTWEDFIGWCKRIKAAGYIPFAIEGNYDSFWAMRVGWMLRTYVDQYTRDEILIKRCQPGDYCFQEGIDDVWEWDPSDPFNDDNHKVTTNGVRALRALRDGEIRVDSLEVRDMFENLSQLLGPMTQEGWIGTTDALPLFLKGEAAIWLDGAWLLSNFEREMKAIQEAAGADEVIEAFDLGTFNCPTMTGELVDAPARTIEATVGFYSVFQKDQAQNDLEMDFLMFLTSPEGYGIYLRNRLDPNNPNGGIYGPPVVKGVSLPEKYQVLFDGLQFIGNHQKAASGNWISIGYNPETTRIHVDLMQRYFLGEITLDDLLSGYQQACEDNLETYLVDEARWAAGLAALDTPEKEPELLE